MSDCIVFAGRARAGRGEHGKVTVSKRQLTAHRAAYIAAYGELPEGYDVHHRCENKLCVNPEHLEAKPHGQHIREHNTKTHCLRGHSLAGARVYRARNGTAKRNCLACARERRKTCR